MSVFFCVDATVIAGCGFVNLTPTAINLYHVIAIRGYYSKEAPSIKSKIVCRDEIVYYTEYPMAELLTHIHKSIKQADEEG